jgi:hypothetical protein
MTRPTKAIVAESWQYDGVKVAVVREHQVLTWTQPSVVERDEAGEMPEAWLHLQEDDARAIYEALAQHFGGAGHDTRALRRDYDAERARVDKALDALIQAATHGRNP